MRAWIIVVSLVLLSPVWAAQDGNEGLYEMAAPPDSAFVRVLNLSDRQIQVALDDWQQPLVPGALGDYLYRPEGAATIRIDGQPFAYRFLARSVQTLAYRDGALTLFQDQYFDSRIKALLVMYNLTPSSASLQTLNGAVNVIGPLAEDSSGAREINGVKVALRVSLDDGRNLPLAPAVLERGRVYSVVVFGGASGPQARLEESHVATVP
ncbi:alginate O-acetyltransferase [Alcanivorax hongdengensis A-11-3]|uniref:Alginate biosynthesis protein AlgF n=1 Tax=Alcanivorax hongdengensis A-11-3 TaxID=1177179 RepID=L0WBU2_9GAMM|nr:alginate O-acetyltransferase AlgF [Alcanivorax hongdengensis]EKF74406.1 alginate O-acetyltransferase [Alcanivorax hongdengensis A-11-3]